MRRRFVAAVAVVVLQQLLLQIAADGLADAVADAGQPRS